MPIPRLPVPQKKKTDAKQIKHLMDVMMIFRKELEYLLNNLDDDNILSIDAAKIRNLRAEVIVTDLLFADYIQSNTAVTEVLYAEEGRIARLTVDHLLTGDFLSGSEKIYFIDAKDQYLRFIEGTRRDDLPMVHYTDRDGNPLYWDSADHNYITPNETEWPVMVYVYDLMTKLEMNFEYGDSGYMEPKIILGAGSGSTEHPEYGKGYIYKGIDGLLLKYITSAGKELTAYLNEDGIDITHTAADDSVITLSLNENGIIQTGNTGEQGLRNIHISDTAPSDPQKNDLWIDTDDYSRFDYFEVSENAIIDVTQAEFITITGSSPIVITLLSTLASAGCIKKIKNRSSAIVTLSGTIDGGTTNILYPHESVELIWNGTDWSEM